jgi:hypothetical protein
MKEILLDIETLEIGGKTYIWEFCGIDTKTGEVFHLLNSSAINTAIDVLEGGFNVKYFGDKQLEYISSHKIHSLSCCKFFMAIQRLLLGYTKVVAYNVNFDKGKLIEAGLKFTNNTKFVCLWGSFVNALLDKNYVVWCIANGFKSKTGLPTTNAETAYKYVTGKVEYIHQHTALSDCLSELVIYEAIKKKRKKLASSASYSNVQKKIKELVNFP